MSLLRDQGTVVGQLNAEYIERLQAAILGLHHLDSKWMLSVPVKETLRGQTVWDGTVEVFEVTGHPEAKNCYAWSNHDPKDEQITAILGIPPVTSPIHAVHAYILATARH